ncbi:hypothetical protein Taro_022952, partial [Colocasia esculenta]|nr:hypothetical protein [Colocasia esculenta]
MDYRLRVRLHSSTFRDGLRRRGHSRRRLLLVRYPFQVFGSVGGGADGRILGESRGSEHRGRYIP